MISTITHAAAFVLPASAAAVAGMAVLRAFALRQKLVVVPVTTDRSWTGSSLRTYGTSFDPQSRGSSG